MDDHVTRRRLVLLGGASLGGVAALAGCIDGRAREDDGGQVADEEPEIEVGGEAGTSAE